MPQIIPYKLVWGASRAAGGGVCLSTDGGLWLHRFSCMASGHREALF